MEPFTPAVPDGSTSRTPEQHRLDAIESLLRDVPQLKNALLDIPSMIEAMQRENRESVSALERKVDAVLRVLRSSRQSRAEDHDTGAKNASAWVSPMKPHVVKLPLIATTPHPFNAPPTTEKYPAVVVQTKRADSTTPETTLEKKTAISPGSSDEEDSDHEVRTHAA